MRHSALSAAVATHKALGHPVRLRLLAMLREAPLCVCQMTAVLDLAASTVSAHLAVLRRAGLVEETKEGRWVRYGWPEDPAARAAAAEAVRRIARDSRLASDARLVRRLRKVPLDALCRVDLDLTRVGIRREA